MSKFLNSCRVVPMLRRQLPPVTLSLTKRGAGDIIPPNQYDTPYPKRLNLFYAMRKYWEINPLVFVTSFATFLAVAATLWSFKHKVDFAFNRNRDETISRTMDLRRPTVHKVITIDQEYKPWPEMQDVLDKMKEAEKATKTRKGACVN